MKSSNPLYRERFYKKAIEGRDGNLSLRVEALEEKLRRILLKDATTIINQIISQEIEFISTSVAGGTSDPTDPAFTGVVLSKSGQYINGVLYHFALVIDGVVFNGLGDDGSGAATVNGLNIDAGLNVAILSSISEFLTTGDGNIAIGSGVLEQVTSGDRNIGIGEGALNALTEGSDNVVIGRDAAGDNIEGNNNIVLGSGAFELNQYGSENVIIGVSALHENEGSNNVVIGPTAGTRQTTASNRLFIDNQDRGTAADELIKALIYGIFDADPANQELHFNANVDVNGVFTVNGSPVSGGGLTQAQVMARMS